MTIHLVDIEGVPTRYTCEWKEYLPRQLHRATMETVNVITGGETPQATTPGAFLNFGGTNVYKSKQLEVIGEMFCEGKVKDGDYFLYTDAWNPTVIQLKYMAELLGVKIKIGGLWHAGSYDPHDFLGRKIGNTPWVRHAEKSMFEVYDNNFFATEFHIDMFLREVYGIHGVNDRDGAALIESEKIVRTGWPMEYLAPKLKDYKNMKKEDIILFPHRLAPEKQVEIFSALAREMPEYTFIICQESELSKEEYHELLGKAKLIFSANLQETLGISWYEGTLLNVIPMVPDRLSYSEMALDEFKYPSHWTENFKSFSVNKGRLKHQIKDYMENYDSYLPALYEQAGKLGVEYFNGSKIYGKSQSGK